MLPAPAVAPIAGVMTYIQAISPVQDEEVIMASLSIVTQHQEGQVLRAVLRSTLYPSRLFEFYSDNRGRVQGTVVMYNAVDKYQVIFDEALAKEWLPPKE